MRMTPSAKRMKHLYCCKCNLAADDDAIVPSDIYLILIAIHMDVISNNKTLDFIDIFQSLFSALSSMSVARGRHLNQRSLRLLM